MPADFQVGEPVAFAVAKVMPTQLLASLRNYPAPSNNSSSGCAGGPSVF